MPAKAVRLLRCPPDIAHYADRSFINREVKPFSADDERLVHASSVMNVWETFKGVNREADEMKGGRVGRCQFNI